MTGAVKAGSQPLSKTEAAAVQLARTAVAARAAKDAKESEPLRVVGVAPAQWRDASLGCPDRGVVYAAILTSGYEVRLRGSDREHIVHVSAGKAVVCDSREDTKVSPSALLSASLKAAEATKAALGARLEIRASDVRILSTRPATDAARTSCPGAPPAPVGAAFVIEARAKGAVYRYYSDTAVTRSCDPA